MSLKTLRYFIGLVAYPKGSIYCTYSNLTTDDISSIWGGTWEEIKGRFLYGGGDSDILGDVGGSAHTVLPAHTHTLVHTHTLLAGSTAGTGGAHTHTFGASKKGATGTNGAISISYGASGSNTTTTGETCATHTHTVNSADATTLSTRWIEPTYMLGGVKEPVPLTDETEIKIIENNENGENYGNLPPFSLVKMFVRTSL